MELVLGSLWGAPVATVFLMLTWRHAPEAPMLRRWMIARASPLMIVLLDPLLASTRVTRWIAMLANALTAVHAPHDPGHL